MSNAEISSSNQKPSTHKISQNDQIDRRRLILLNLPHDLIREYLELYIDHLSGETEIEKIDYSNLDDTTIMVTFKTELDMDEVRRRHKIRSTLNHSEISLGEVTASRTVLIRNLPVDISRDVLELYFSNRRRSDGGEVREVSIDVEQKQALVTFVDVEDAQRVSNREHVLHEKNLDVRVFHRYMGVEPFADGSSMMNRPSPIYFYASDDQRFLILLRNKILVEKLGEALKSFQSEIFVEKDEFVKVSSKTIRDSSDDLNSWRKEILEFVDRFVSENISVEKIPLNKYFPSLNKEKVKEFVKRDKTRLFELISSSDNDQIVVTASKDQLERSINELNEFLSSSNVFSTNFHRKQFSAIRDVKVEQQKPSSSESLRLNSLSTIFEQFENLRSFQIDFLSTRFIELARRTYQNISINVDSNKRRLTIEGIAEQVLLCKNYFRSIIDGIVHEKYSISKELATFLGNPDTVEIILENLGRSEQVCVYEIERNQNPHRNETTTNNHKLIIYSLTRDSCHQIHRTICQDVRVSSIMLDKDDRRCFNEDSWHSYLRNLYSNTGAGFRRRRVLLQVKQNQLIFVGFQQDVNDMRKHIYDYFMENAISFYESD